MHQATADWKSGYMPLIIGGIGAMASALFMPWITVVTPFLGRITRTGVDTRDGRLFALALFLLALVARREACTPSATTRSVLLVGVGALALALSVEYRDMTRLVAHFNADFAHAELGFGLSAMGIGLCASLAGVLKRRLLLQPRRPSEADAEQFAGY